MLLKLNDIATKQNIRCIWWNGVSGRGTTSETGVNTNRHSCGGHVSFSWVSVHSAQVRTLTQRQNYSPIDSDEDSEWDEKHDKSINHRFLDENVCHIVEWGQCNLPKQKHLKK